LYSFSYLYFLLIAKIYQKTKECKLLRQNAFHIRQTASTDDKQRFHY
jgi:hypothetical protein